MGLGAAMRACVAAQQWQTALSLWRGGPPDPVLFGAQVAAFQAASHWRPALQVVAVAEGLLGPSLRLRCAAMAATPWQVTLGMLDAMRHGHRPSTWPGAEVRRGLGGRHGGLQQLHLQLHQGAAVAEGLGSLCRASTSRSRGLDIENLGWFVVVFHGFGLLLGHTLRCSPLPTSSPSTRR